MDPLQAGACRASVLHSMALADQSRPAAQVTEQATFVSMKSIGKNLTGKGAPAMLQGCEEHAVCSGGAPHHHAQPQALLPSSCTMQPWVCRAAHNLAAHVLQLI